MDRLDTNGYYALGLPFYASVVVAELLVARARRQRVYRFAPTVGNLAAGVGEVVIGLFLGPILLGLYDFGYDHIALVHWGSDAGGQIIAWTLAFLLGDLGYYVYHRAGHAVAVLWAIHGVHHHAEEMNVSVALRHPWLSDLYSAPFYVILPLAGVPAGHFFIAISLISFYSLTVHSRFFNRPGFYFLVTPATHIVHHARNPRYLGKNLGAMFTIWDRLFGTHVELDPADPPTLGAAEGYRTHDGALAQWLGFRDLLRNARQASTFGDTLRVFFSHPGWRPRGMERVIDPAPRAEVPRRTQVYVALQMALTLALAAWVLWFRSRHSPLFLVLGAALVMWSLLSIGGLLDGRAGARRFELVRVAAVALTVMFVVAR